MKSLALALLTLTFALDGGILAADCPISEAFETGELQDDALDEASGLAVSQAYENVFYSHNDHNGDEHIFAFRETGEPIASIKLEGVVMDDFEDLAVGPGPGGLSYLYVGDIGNNGDPRESVQIYRFVEPDLTGYSGGEEYLLPSSEITRFDVRTPMLPDEDMETLMVDPVEPHDWYLVEKDHDDGTSNVYRFFSPPDYPEPGKVYNMPLVAVLDDEYTFLVSGDISPSGDRIILERGHSEGAWMWARNEGQFIEDALALSAPCILDIHEEEQGEAVAFGPSGDVFYTISEGEGEPIWKYNFIP